MFCPGLFPERRFVSQTACPTRRWCWSAGHCRVERAGDRDLHGRGGSDEYGIGAARSLGRPGRRPARWALVGRCGFVLGLVPGAPRTVGAFARTRVEVPARSPVSATSENGVSWVSSRTVTPGPSPISGCRRARVVGRRRIVDAALRRRVRHSRDDDGGRRNGCDQRRWRAIARRHRPMLRVFLVVSMG